MAIEDFEYVEEEEVDEIDYYEIVSLKEIIKLNPSFIAFSNEEIYNYLFNFLKSKTKAENFLKLFTDVIEKQKNKININNFIVVADAKRDDFSELDIDEFILKIKNSNKEQIQIAYKNKNKLWFPLIYDNENTKIKFNATNTTIIELTNQDSNDKYIIFKDDEREIPIMGVYFYEPITTEFNYLNEKIASHLIKDENRQKDKMVEGTNYSSFEDLMKNYKIELPLNKIDTDEYHYNNLNSLLKKFNYDLDTINITDFKLLKSHLEQLNKNEKIEEIKYSKNKFEPLIIKNQRFYFFKAITDINKLIDITFRSSSKLKKDLDTLHKTKDVVDPLPILNNLNELILHLDEGNFDNIIKNLKEVRKNLSIENSIQFLNSVSNVDVNEIKKLFENIENKFNLLLSTYKDIYKISFSFHDEEHEIKEGNNNDDYEGMPVRVDEFKKNAVYIDNDDEDNDDINEPIDINAIDEELKYYYKNYSSEKGFTEALKIVLPLLIKLKDASKLPIDNKYYKLIITHLFNIHRGIPEKYMIVKEKIKGDFDDDYYKKEALKPIKFILNSASESDKLKEANLEYMQIILNMIYDILCKLAILTQNDILSQSLLFTKERCYSNCIHLWDDYGAPFDMNSKNGVLFYIMCVFRYLFEEEFDSENFILDKNYEKIIITKLKNEYQDDLEAFNKIEKKKKKDNKGLETGKKLIEIYKTKDFKSNKFLETYIQALIYMPSYKYEKIHKYLLGCCLERIDDKFTADTYLILNREELKRAKTKLAEERVLNKPIYKRFYLEKEPSEIKKVQYKAIGNFISYENLYDSSLEDWFNSLIENNKTYLSKSNVDDIHMKLRNTYNIHINNYLTSFFDKNLSSLIKTKNYDFTNYKQILIAISHILYFHLKEKAKPFIANINETIKELDKLNSIIDDDNITDINQIRSIIVIRALCLPSIPDISTNAKLIPSLNITNELNKSIINDVNKRIFIIINNCQMPTLEDQINYINKIREENKDKILASLNRKTREEKDILKEMKKIGLNVEDEDEKPQVNREINDEDLNMEGENEFSLGREDEYDNDDDLDNPDYGFIYAGEGRD
jgi:hypothetical protein